MKKLVSHLSYSRVVSTLALFIALGGGAYALSLGKNDVKSRHIAKGAVKSSDVAKNTLKGSDVKQDSLKGSDILESTFDIGQFSAAASTPFDPAGPIRCDPEFGSGPPFVPCGQVSLTTPVAGRILAIASGELIAERQRRRVGAGCTSTARRSARIADRTPEVTHGFAVSGVSDRLRRDPSRGASLSRGHAGTSGPRSTASRAVLVGG